MRKVLRTLRTNFWYILVAILAFTIFILSGDKKTIEKLQSFLRRKETEESVNQIRNAVKDRFDTINKTDEELAALAKKYERERGSIKDATDKEIQDFYRKALKGRK